MFSLVILSFAVFGPQFILGQNSTNATVGGNATIGINITGSNPQIECSYQVINLHTQEHTLIQGCFNGTPPHVPWPPKPVPTCHVNQTIVQPAPGQPSGPAAVPSWQQPSNIVGGVEAELGRWPWQAGLKRSARDKIFCGGSLIDPQWVVTASHCLYNMKKYSAPGKIPHIEVVLGEFNQDKKEKKEVLVNVSKLYLHGKYDPKTQDYDIALLQLQHPVKTSKTVKPICLPDKSIDFPSGTSCYVTGFGVTEQGGEVATKLQEASVPIVPQDTCQKAYKAKKITPRMFCAGFAQGGIDACQGDSGGPLACMFDGRWLLKGVVSWGVGCARPGAYGVYSNVNDMLPWIQNIISTNEQETDLS